MCCGRTSWPSADVMSLVRDAHHQAPAKMSNGKEIQAMARYRSKALNGTNKACTMKDKYPQSRRVRGALNRTARERSPDDGDRHAVRYVACESKYEDRSHVVQIGVGY